MTDLHDDSAPTIDGYDVVRPLGSGGMGEVFLAHDPAGRPVAIKVMHDAFSRDPAFRMRFAREVTAARRVRGPWTAEVIDADPDAPRPWLVTEFVDGPTLGAAVDEDGPMPEPVVRTLGGRLAAALGAIHDAGLVHRDLTPANVLLSPDGPRVVDFGVTRVLDATDLTLTGHAVGTPAFMAPEQLGDGRAGPPADVFALGSLLYLAATGRSPFADSSMVATLRRVLTADVDLSPVPPGLRPALERCLQVDPLRRPGTRELAADLAGRPAGRTRTRTPIATLVRTPRADGTVPAPGRRPFRRVALAALAAALLAGGAVVAAAVVAGPSSPRPATPVIPPAWVAAQQSAARSATPTAGPTTVLSDPFPNSTATVSGWTVTSSRRHDLAYDVPPAWKPLPPESPLFFEDSDGRVGRLYGRALFRPGFCGGRDARALTGVWSSPTGGSAAAQDAVRFWAGYYAATGRDARPRDVVSSPVSVAGVAGTRARATVDVPVDDTCDPVTAAVHVVVLPSASGGSVVWVLLAGLDAGDTPPPGDVDRMVASIRPTGLGCDGRSAPPGRWC